MPYLGRMPATILLADHTGRLGNKLILFSHVIAAAEEYGCRVVNLSILPAAQYFEGLHLNPWGSYPGFFWPVDLRWMFRAFRKPVEKWVHSRRNQAPRMDRWVAVLDHENRPTCWMDTPKFARLSQSMRLLVLWGYPFRCPALIRKHAAKIRAFFAPRKAQAGRAAGWISNAKATGQKTLVVHFRQGDVKETHVTRYIPPEIYAQAIARFRETPSGRDTRVWICSDEPTPTNLFPEDAIQGIPRPLGEDLWLLSHADFVMGYDSTLSAFGAFLGDSVFLKVNPADGSFAVEPEKFIHMETLPREAS